MKKIIFITLFACICMPLAADEPQDDKKSVEWSGDVSIGATFTRGNTHTNDTNITGNALRRGETNRLTLGASYLHGEKKDLDTREKSTSKDNWFMQGKYDHFLSKQVYTFTNGRYEQDRVADLNERALLGTGIGYQWAENAFSFSTEAGTAWVREDYDNGSSSDWSAQAGYALGAALNDRVQIMHAVRYYPRFSDFSDFLLKGETELRSSLTARMFASFKYTLDYDATPAPDQRRLDSRFMISIGIGF